MSRITAILISYDNLYGGEPEIYRWRHIGFVSSLQTLLETHPEINDKLMKNNYTGYKVIGVRNVYLMFTEEHPFYNLGMFDTIMHHKSLYDFFNQDRTELTTLLTILLKEVLAQST
jgi:hypothetical protein